ncbi:NADP-dependent oxidoreductase [Streptomyces sp. NPDC096311]|uniref:NADP-dependent oxidoreductase n=1 Tax=Streptomyces sp. NPDC096311 TaxID=3366083 RepID=UPI003815BFF6
MSAAITFSEYGAPGVLTLSDVPVPQPGPGQVRVRVRATAVNPIDLKLRSGELAGIMPLEFPFTPGQDVAGVVDEAGEGAGFAPGDEVFGSAHSGGYSEYVLLDEAFAKPAQLSFETVAAMITVGETAYRALEHLHVSPGQTLLVHGAGGAVGAVAVQLAVARGLTVIGTAGEHDFDRVGKLGATPVRYGEGWAQRVRDAEPGRVDRVLDTAGAGVLTESIALTGIPERVITIADLTFAEHGVRFTGLDPADRFPQALPLLADLVARGELEVPVWRTFPLAQAAQAHAEIEARHNKGKVVLLP